MKEVYGSMALNTQETYSIDDILALPENVRAEVIDGSIYYMAPPNTRHQKLVSFLIWKIGTYIDSTHGDCQVFPGPFGVYFENDKHNFMEPDISIVCNPKQLTDFGCNGIPDLIMEIVSPSGIYHDYVRKMNKYFEKGIKEYWIIDPMKNRITVLNYVKDERAEYTLSDKVPVGIYDDFFIDFSELKL